MAGPWADRKDLECCAESGVYMMAIFQGAAPQGPGDRTAPEVVYVGETRQPFWKRWCLFDRRFKTGKGSHSGGGSYRAQFGDDTTNLYVAAMPIGSDDEVGEAYRLYVERKVILDYVVRHGHRPCCNSK